MAPTVAISLNGPEDDAARSILNPVSLVLLSVHARFIWFVETAVAERLVGADGMGGVIVVVVNTVVVVIGSAEVVVVVGNTDVVEVAGDIVVVRGVPSHTSPIPSPSLSLWSAIHNPLDEQPITQSASLLHTIPGLSDVAEQLPRFGPFGL